jgi:hypothetical protein
MKITKWLKLSKCGRRPGDGAIVQVPTRIAWLQDRFGSRAADSTAADIMVGIAQMSICSAIARASSTSIPR